IKSFGKRTLVRDQCDTAFSVRSKRARIAAPGGSGTEFSRRIGGRAVWSILEPEAFMPRLNYSLRSDGRSTGLVVVQIGNFRRLSGSLGDDSAAQVMDDVLARLAALRVAMVPGQRPHTVIISRIAEDEVALLIQGVPVLAGVD